MLLFWFIAVAMTAFALWVIVRPLLKKTVENSPRRDDVNVDLARKRLRELKQDLQSGNLDEAQYQQAEEELEQRLADDLSWVDMSKFDSHGQPSSGVNKGRWWTVIPVVIVIPLLSVALYRTLGNPNGIDPPSSNASTETPAQTKEQDIPSFAKMVESLTAHLEEAPEDGEAWKMLGHAYSGNQQFAKAAEAYEKALALQGEHADLLLRYAEALAQSRDNNVAGEPAQAVRKALRLEPENEKALWMAGVAAIQAGDYTDAVGQWQKLLAKSEQGTEEYQLLEGFIRNAQAEVGTLANGDANEKASEKVSEKTIEEATPAVTSDKLTVVVSLADKFADSVDPNDTVFIFVKAAEGPPMPLAATKVKVADLPLTVTFDDSSAMLPAMRLSQFNDVVVTARISKGDQPIAQSGDLQGQIGPIQVDAGETVAISIDVLVP